MWTISTEMFMRCGFLVSKANKFKINKLCVKNKCLIISCLILTSLDKAVLGNIVPLAQFLCKIIQKIWILNYFFLLKKGGFDGQRQKLGSRMSVLSEQSHGSKQLQPLSRGKADCKYNLKVLLTLDTLTLLCIFSIQFPIHFLRCW